MRNPLAIDLFCGLLQPKFLLAANVPIKKLVASRTQYPNHVALRIGDQSPSTITFKLWFVGDLQNSVFAARFARGRQIRKPSTKPVDARIFAGSAAIVDFLYAGFPAMKKTAAFASRANRAVIRTISAVSAWWHDVKVLTARFAVSAVLCHIGLLASSAPFCSGRTRVGAPYFVGADRLERSTTIFTKEIVHGGFLP